MRVFDLATTLDSIVVREEHRLRDWVESPVGRAACEGADDDYPAEAQKAPQPGEESSEVVACGGKHRVDRVAVRSLEIVAVHAMIGLGVADDRFDR